MDEDEVGQRQTYLICNSRSLFTTWSSVTITVAFTMSPAHHKVKNSVSNSHTQLQVFIEHHTPHDCTKRYHQLHTMCNGYLPRQTGVVHNCFMTHSCILRLLGFGPHCKIAKTTANTLNQKTQNFTFRKLT